LITNSLIHRKLSVTSFSWSIKYSWSGPLMSLFLHNQTLDSATSSFFITAQLLLFSSSFKTKNLKLQSQLRMSLVKMSFIFLYTTFSMTWYFHKGVKCARILR
jgi:hypothetical protein